jgi:DNA-binding response OmpR family regulator
MEAKTVDVHICQMRARLKPHRIAIETIWGTGYCWPAQGDGFDSAGDRG